jgi:hypothetical protein
VSEKPVNTTKRKTKPNKGLLLAVSKKSAGDIFQSSASPITGGKML